MGMRTCSRSCAHSRGISCTGQELTWGARPKIQDSLDNGYILPYMRHNSCSLTAALGRDDCTEGGDVRHSSARFRCLRIGMPQGRP